MNTASLIALLLQLFAQYGPDLVKQVTDLIRGNPQNAGETDDQYIARINTQITATLDDAAGKDADVEKP
jgi:hypothetical protein